MEQSTGNVMCVHGLAVWVHFVSSKKWSPEDLLQNIRESKFAPLKAQNVDMLARTTLKTSRSAGSSRKQFGGKKNQPQIEEENIGWHKESKLKKAASWECRGCRRKPKCRGNMATCPDCGSAQAACPAPHCGKLVVARAANYCDGCSTKLPAVESNVVSRKRKVVSEQSGAGARAQPTKKSRPDERESERKGPSAKAQPPNKSRRDGKRAQAQLPTKTLVALPVTVKRKQRSLRFRFDYVKSKKPRGCHGATCARDAALGHAGLLQFQSVFLIETVWKDGIIHLKCATTQGVSRKASERPQRQHQPLQRLRTRIETVMK